MIPKDFQKQINQKLNLFFAEKLNLVKSRDSRLIELVEQIKDVTLRGGDRMRSYLVTIGYEIGGGRDIKHYFPVLLAVELFHTFALVHDDIMDRGEVRRGKPTIHAYFTHNLRSPSSGLAGLGIRFNFVESDLHFGNSLALLAGDLCSQWAQELFDTVENKSNKPRQIFNQMREEVMYGQVLDTWGMEKNNANEIRHMYETKSGNYSVKNPLLLGLALSGMTSGKWLLALERYGKNVGLAFQFKDDLLGIFGEEKQTGKSNVSDIKEGKWTLLIAYTYAKLNFSDQQKLKKVLGNSTVSSKEIAWVKKKIKETGAKTKVETEMKRFIQEAKEAIKILPNEKKQELEEIADFIIERNS